MHRPLSRAHLRAVFACLSVLATGLATTAAPASAADTEGQAAVARVDAARVDAALRDYVEAGRVVGVSALVWQDGREAYYGAHGLADREAGRPMARDTLVRIYSMTKPVTGVALMQLYEQGRFQLDDPVARYLPEFAATRVYAGTDVHGAPMLVAPQRPITIRDLMRHTAGFVEGEWHPGPVGEMYRKADPGNLSNTLAESVRRIASVPLLYQPGTRWVYSPSVDVQARLVEVLSGQPFDAYLRKHLFDPLRMGDTRYTPPSADRDRLAALYRRSDDGVLSRVPEAEVLAIDTARHPLRPGSWGLVSSLDDYMRFARMLLDGGQLDGVRILQPATVRLMGADALPASIALTDRSWLPGKGPVGFGIDFAVRTASPRDARDPSGEIGEMHWDGLANTLFWVDPVNRIAAVLFTQYLPPAGTPLHKAFRDAVYHGDSSAGAPPPAP